MYETKKEGALRTLEKKQSKVDEINKLLEDEILPALQKLRRERGQYMQWAAANSELDRLRRFCVAYEYVRAQQAQGSVASDSQAVQARITALGSTCALLEADVGAAADRITVLASEKQAQEAGEVKQLAAATDELSKQLVKETASWTHKKDALKAEQQSQAKLKKGLADGERAVAEKAAALAAADSSISGGREAEEELSAELGRAERELAAVQCGGSAAEGMEAGKSLAEQLADARAAAVAAQSEAKQAAVKAKHADKQLGEQRKLCVAKQAEAAALAKELAGQKAKLEALHAAVRASPYDADVAAAAEATRVREAEAVRQTQDRVDALAGQLAQLDFSFSDPERGFDRSRVKGVLARLIRVKEPACATALEVAAGGKLYQVVVDTDDTAKALLERGKLRTRVTLIPLNRIDGRGLSARQTAAADRLAGKDARMALSLVGCDADVQAAVGYVFGGTFVCKDTATARRVSFSPDVQATCVTVDGDLINPAGLLTGGSRDKGASLLPRLHALAELEAELAQHKAKLEAAQATLREMAAAAAAHQKLETERSLQEHALSLLQARIDASESHQAAEAVRQLEIELQAATAAAVAAEAARLSSDELAGRLQKEMAAFGSQREQRLKKAEAWVKSAKCASSAPEHPFYLCFLHSVLGKGRVECPCLARHKPARRKALGEARDAVKEKALAVATLRAEHDAAVRSC